MRQYPEHLRQIKSYVDSQIIVNATPNATSTVLEKIQLTGDLLGSSATFPTVAPGAITLFQIRKLKFTL